MEKSSKRNTTIWKTLVVTIFFAAQAALTQTPGIQGKIGDYEIPKDKLQDNFCTAVDQTKFHDVSKVDTLYIGFVNKLLDGLKEPVRKYLEQKDFVSSLKFLILICLGVLRYPDLRFRKQKQT